MSSAPSWAVQTNLNSLDPALVVDACHRLGLGVHEFEARTGRDVPDLPTDSPLLFYGSTFLVRSALRAGRWRPCAYFDEDQFKYSRYLDQYGARMLNQDAERVTLRELDARELSESSQFFIRPDSDFKEFAGALWPVPLFRKFLDKVKSSSDPSALDTVAFIAPRKLIHHEWRLFLVSGRVSSGSHYRFMGDVEISPEVPRDVISFAEQAAAIWSPAPAFVVDIASVDDELYVLELNGLHSCGFYAADVDAIVRDVSSIACT